MAKKSGEARTNRTRSARVRAAGRLKVRKASLEYEIGSGNVYADLGFQDASEMLVKAQLVSKIAELIQKKGYTQSEAAALLGLTQPKLSELLRGRFRGVSERRLMDCLTSLGRDIEIVVKPAPRSRASGKLSVVFA
jgi:predicted XRE-type DNA-binding protein